MDHYYIIRLGADSETEIRKIDAVHNYTSTIFSIAIKCKQVPKDIASGDIAIIWLGTNNNKGAKTPWVQGVRAIGRIERVDGNVGYSEAKLITISLGVILPKSVTKVDIIKEQSMLYPFIVEMPVLGANNYSSQVIQKIDFLAPGQSLYALFYALDEIVSGFKNEVLNTYPQILNIFESPPLMSPPHSKVEKYVLEDTTSEEDEDGMEKDKDRDDEIEIPFDPTKIDIIAKPMTISSLEDRLSNGELDLTPDFQRQANVWDSKRKARLIESILLKIPLPSFYFSEDTEGGYAVVDGLQRLCAVFHFKNARLLNEATGASVTTLRLKGLQYLKELDGKTFEEMDRKFQRRISELEITANIIRANTPSAVKFNVFARLNQGGMPLNAQEIRNAIFPGEWRNELRKLAESTEFTKATDNKVQKTRQQDIELVLRYVALWQIGPPYRRPGGQTLDEFLNATVEHILTFWNAEKWLAAGNAFHHAIKATSKIRGRHSFRKSAGNQQRKPINRGLFEAEMIVFGSINSEELNFLIEHRTHVEELILVALGSEKDFTQSLLYGTGSPESSNARIGAFYKIINGVSNV